MPLHSLPTAPSDHVRSTSDASASDDPFVDPNSRTSTVGERPPSLKPLDFGESSLLGRWNHQSHTKAHTPRPTIGAPYSFRRLDQTESQSQSLVPLRLGPVILRESPIPDTDLPTPPKQIHSPTAHGRSESTQDLLNDAEKRQSYRAVRETPFQRCQQRSSSSTPVHLQNVQMPPVESSPIEEPRPTRTKSRSTRSSNSLRRRAPETPSSGASRSSSEWLRPKRKRSLPSVRRPYAESGDQDIDKEILELNTIVEERRAEAARESSSSQHIPAIAPHMQVRARSETLDAIGSALSRPATRHDTYRDSGRLDGFEFIKPVLRRTASDSSWSSSRVSGWLSSVVTSSRPPAEPFYKCQPAPRRFHRSHSEASMCTSVTELESPSLTAASSPTTKGHSRSHTGESRITPLSMPPFYGAAHYGLDAGAKEKELENQWPFVMTPPNQVGVAL